MKIFRANRVQRFRANAGFNDEEVANFKEEFAKYDNDGSGDISSKELIKLLLKLFPEASTSPKEKERLQRLLAKVDEGGDGSLDFSDFLMLMREYWDEMDEIKLRKERGSVLMTGFSPQEVEEFRVIFQKYDIDKSGDLNGMEVKMIFDRIVKVSPQMIDELVKE